MYKAKVAVCSDIRTKHSTQSKHHVEFLEVKPLWYVTKLLGFKRLMKLTSISKWTNTSVTRSVINAGGPVAACSCSTCIIFILATNTSIIIRTRAVETRTKVLATSSMHTRAAYATFRCCLTEFSICT